MHIAGIFIDENDIFINENTYSLASLLVLCHNFMLCHNLICHT